MQPSPVPRVLASFDQITEGEIASAEHAGLSDGLPEAERSLLYALRVSHCVPRLTKIATLASRWGIANSGAGGAGLESAKESPNWASVHAFLADLYLRRFDSLADLLVREAEAGFAGSVSTEGDTSVVDRALDALNAGVGAFTRELQNLPVHAQRWTDALHALRERTPPPASQPKETIESKTRETPVAPLAANLVVELQHASVVCFAMEQVGVPIVPLVRIRNTATASRSGLTLQVELLPDLVSPLLVPIPELRGGEVTEFGPLDVRLPPGRLRELLEAERAVLNWRVLDGETTLSSGRGDIEVLAYNEWPGARGPGALLATFVAPNHPVVGRILQRVRDRLLADTGDGGISGYQAGSGKRVIEQVRAVYATVQDLGITYVGLPASFERSGQKVRLPDIVLDGKMGNCLDVSLLVAACLEQMGLAPLLILVQGHAFPGVWMIDERFPEVLAADAARIRNQIELHQILAFDSSTTVDTGRPSLESAVEVANRHLREDGKFLYALDVRAARRDRYRPLPIRMSVEAAAPDTHAPTGARQLSDVILEESFDVPEPATDEQPAPPPPDTVVARFRTWKERLLDLTLHNRLLNFRPGAGQAIPLDVPQVAEFEDLLAGHERFQILPRPPRDTADARSRELADERGASNDRKEQLVADMRAKKLHALYTEGELFSRARELARQARTDLEEGGVITIYAALGVLKWYESPSSEMARFAPLLLAPIKIEYDARGQRVLLSRTEDESLGNVTLAEKMRRDFALDLSILADPDLDQSGIDIPGLLRDVRAGIQRMPRWEVLEDVHVGHFTFAKFLMWKDLEDNSEVLLRNPVVRHIADGGLAPFPDPVGDVSPHDLDDTVPPAELPTVVDADSTQLAAVASALRGRSFVLEGPPGTGKSQTITNLIAATLAAGRSVLFVSEKMAALGVVHRRLEQVGLGDYCLELHSNRAIKRQVLDSLKRSYDRQRQQGDGDWDTRSSRLQELRSRLNSYARALHASRPLGMNFFRASSRLLELRGKPKLNLPLPDGADLTRERLHGWLELADAMAVAARRVEPVSAHPWRASELVEWSGAAQTSIEGSLRGALEALSQAEASAQALGEVCGIEPVQNLERLETLATTVERAAVGKIPQSAWNATTWAEHSKLAMEWSALAEEDARERNELGRRWNESFWQLDLEERLAPFTKYASSNALLSWFGLRSARAALRPTASGRLPDRLALRSDLQRALACRGRKPSLEDQQRRLSLALGTAWRTPGGVPELRALLERASAVQAAAARLRIAGVDVPERLVVRAEGPPTGEATSRVAREALSCASALGAALRELGSVGHLDGALPNSENPRQFPIARAAIENWQRSIPRLRDWCLYAKACAPLERGGFGELVAAHRSGRVAAADLRAALERSLLEVWIPLIRDSEPTLREFSGEEHNDAVARFESEDREHLGSGRRIVLSRLDARRPATLAVPTSGSEASVLIGQSLLKSRHMAIRKLFDRIPNLLPRLKPCLLMSPLSVAQYLPATGRRFDLVVFDEASQIATHDAIGAIGRGEQVIVVGDSRQLPPTNFFKRTLDDDDPPDDNDITELESVLDEACRVRIPRQWLGWHYRSRHESLIDFSNRNYYENRLQIYASARWRADDLGIHWYPVPHGVYELGRTRTNPLEAERLVSVLVETLRKTKPGTRSFGVVTFSVPQQSEIEDRLERARVQFPEIEAHFSEELIEPVFVKNLENVQGDERDEILMSVCYGPDERGRVYMNFGPLNRTGGERRLNVAITRARCMLRVFSTLRHDQIDLTRTNQVGARHLRAFLQYAAEQGTLTPDTRPSARAFDSEFERQVHDALLLRGQTVDCQVGCGGYRIDLAIRHPTMPGVYALGVECDGAPYHSAATARDRDRLRQQVLEGLGWRMHRVWSSDWWFDRDREIDKLITAVEQAIAHATAGVPKVETPPSASSQVAEAPRIEQVHEVAPVAVTGPPTVPYRCAELTSPRGAGGDIHSTSRASEIDNRIQLVVDTEGPLHMRGLTATVARCFGVGRITDRVRSSVGERVNALERQGRLQVRQEFAWPARVDPAQWKLIRVPEEGDGPRDLEEIPIEELANAARWFLSTALSLPFRDLTRATIRMFGYTSATKRAEERMRLVVALLEKEHCAERKGDLVSWRNR